MANKFSVKLYALLIFCLSTLFIYGKLILYQKNKRKVVSWRIMEVVFVLGIVRLFIGAEPSLPLWVAQISTNPHNWRPSTIAF